MNCGKSYLKTFIRPRDFNIKGDGYLHYVQGPVPQGNFLGCTKDILKWLK